MKKIIFFFFLWFPTLLFGEYPTSSYFSVIYIQHTLPLSEKEPLHRYLYVNIGSNHGAQLGDTFIVYRKNPIFNGLDNIFYQDALFPIGKIKLIHTQENLSIAIQELKEHFSAKEKTLFFSPLTILLGDIFIKTPSLPLPQKTPLPNF